MGPEEPSDQQVAAAGDVKSEEVQKFRDLLGRHVVSSFDEDLDAEGIEVTQPDDDNMSQPESIVDQGLDHDWLGSELDKLPERDDYILKARYGLVDGQAHTYEQVGEKLKLTAPGVRHIEQRLLKRLRSACERSNSSAADTEKVSTVRKTNRRCSVNMELELCVFVIQRLLASHGKSARSETEIWLAQFIATQNLTKILDSTEMSQPDSLAANIVTYMIDKGYLRLAFSDSELLLTQTGFDWYQQMRSAQM
jgi:hypothetical protein